MKLNKRLLMWILAFCLLSFSSAYAQNTKNILVFGDSLTWGWKPSKPIIPTVRHAMKDRWTTAMEKELGEGYHIVVEGLSGRTTNMDDPNRPTLNGAPYLMSAITSHEPLDLVIIMLGTNDMKDYLKRSAFEVGLGMGELINIIQEHPMIWNRTNYPAPKILVMSPPALSEKLDPFIQGIFKEGIGKSKKLAKVYESIAKAAGEHFFDAGSVISTDGIDGVHFSASTNMKLGKAVAKEVKAIFALK